MRIQPDQSPQYCSSSLCFLQLSVDELTAEFGDKASFALQLLSGIYHRTERRIKGTSHRTERRIKDLYHATERMFKGIYYLPLK